MCDPPSPRNVRPASPAGHARRVPLSTPTAVGRQEPRCLHPTLRQDPVSKSPESHFLPRTPLPLPVNHLGLAFAWSSLFVFLFSGFFFFLMNSIIKSFTRRTYLSWMSNKPSGSDVIVPFLLPCWAPLPILCCGSIFPPPPSTFADVLFQVLKFMLLLQTRSVFIVCPCSALQPLTFQVCTFPRPYDYIQTKPGDRFSSFYQNEPFITQLSASCFPHLAVSRWTPSKLSASSSLDSFSEVWLYICKWSRGQNFGEEFKTCLSDSKNRDDLLR